jgi:hypothetical protein
MYMSAYENNSNFDTIVMLKFPLLCTLVFGLYILKLYMKAGNVGFPVMELEQAVANPYLRSGQIDLTSHGQTSR